MFVIGLLLMVPSVIYHSEAQISIGGVCPDLRVKTEFDFYQYQGIWYEVEKYFFLPEITGTCVYVRYKNFRPENATFEADIVETEKLTRKHIVIPCTGRLTGPQDRSAKINLRVNVRIPLSPVAVMVDYPYCVLDTDYRTFSIKWSCKQVGIYNIQTMWILARTRTFSHETRELVHEKLREFGLRPELLIPTDQTNCSTIREE